MSYKIRSEITDIIIAALQLKQPLSQLNKIQSIFEIQLNNFTPELHLPLLSIQNHFKNDKNIVDNIVQTKYNPETVKKVDVHYHPKNSKIVFQLNRDIFISDVFKEAKFPMPRQEQEKIIVEFSSPNIAKPFHMGHLRSTIIGNFIANLFTYQNHEVIKLNYLGDWGTQFGYLKIGMDLAKLSDEEMQKNPIKHLYNAYVNANSLGLVDPTIADEARFIFRQLESGVFKEKDKWQKYREYTIEELKQVYRRLGIVFDEFSWESNYSQKDISAILLKLSAFGILKNETDGKQIAEVGNRRVPVIKSDGSTLYLARDIAALIDRFEKYEFDKIYYVVDNAQSDHFKALFTIGNQLDCRLDNSCHHVKFGRINGMSTRKGNVIFLNDILDEAKDIMLLKQIGSPTTKINLTHDGDHIADVLGISAVFINDLKQRRHKDYAFDWNKVLQVNGDTGIRLQYTHCRLCSLENVNNVTEASECNPKLLNEVEAINLICEIAKFPQIIRKTTDTLESCILVNYLFSLCNAINRALLNLKIKNEASQEIQEQRILLFNTARRTLYTGMKILGLDPLKKM